ncbi:MAG: hypothetical protein M1815_002441 [Lichina confinis]|nr:MAG: hypothetical protein M1815_002441 [Lichina confinis]
MLTQVVVLVAFASSAYASPLAVRRQEPIQDCGGVPYYASKYNCFQLDASGNPVGTLAATPKPCGPAAEAPVAGLDSSLLGAQSNQAAEMSGDVPGGPAYGPSPLAMGPSGGVPPEDSRSKPNPMASDGLEGGVGGPTGPLAMASLGDVSTEDSRSDPPPMISNKVKRAVGGYTLAPFIDGTAYFPCGADFYSDAEYCCETGVLVQRSTGTTAAKQVEEEAPVADAPVADAPVADAPGADAPGALKDAAPLVVGDGASTGPGSSEDPMAATGDLKSPKGLGSEELPSPGGKIYGAPGGDIPYTGRPTSLHRDFDPYVAAGESSTAAHKKEDAVAAGGFPPAEHGKEDAVAPVAPVAPVAEVPVAPGADGPVGKGPTGADGAPENAAAGGMLGDMPELTPELSAYLSKMAEAGPEKPVEAPGVATDLKPPVGAPLDPSADVPPSPEEKTPK